MEDEKIFTEKIEKKALDELLELGIVEEVEDRYAKYTLKKELLEFLKLKSREYLMNILKELIVYKELSRYYDIDSNYTKEDLEYFINDLFKTLGRKKDQYMHRHSQTIIGFFLNLTKEYKCKEIGERFNRSATWSKSHNRYHRVMYKRFLRLSENKEIEYKGRAAFLKCREEEEIEYNLRVEGERLEREEKKDMFITAFREKYGRYPNNLELAERAVSRIFYGECPNCGYLADSYITKLDKFMAICNTCEAELELNTVNKL